MLKGLSESVRRKRPELCPPPWQCSNSYGALCQPVSDPKIDCWNGTSTLFLWFGFECLVTLSKHKSPLKGLIFQDIEMYKGNCDKDTENYTTASLGWVHCCSRGALRKWPLSVSCKYTDMLGIKTLRELHSHTLFMDGWMDGWMDRQTERQTDGWTF